MAQMQQSVDIARPLEEVFAFVANPGNDARWGSNLVEVTQVSPGPLGVGARFRYKARFAGRRFELVREVTEHEPNRRQAVKTISGPLRFGGVRTFEAIPGGTRVTLTGGGRAGGFFGLAEPLLLRAAQRSLRTDLASLKRLLEGQPRSSHAAIQPRRPKRGSQPRSSSRSELRTPPARVVRPSIALRKEALVEATSKGAHQGSPLQAPRGDRHPHLVNATTTAVGTNSSLIMMQSADGRPCAQGDAEEAGDGAVLAGQAPRGRLTQREP